MSAIDWYNQDEVDQMRTKYGNQLKNMVKRKIEAREKDDKESLHKISKSISNLLSNGKLYQQKAEDAGTNW